MTLKHLFIINYYLPYRRGVEQLVARRAHNPEVAGSNPVPATNFGSYPEGRWFESTRRYHFGPLVKWLRHRPFTAVTGVRIP